MVEREALGVVLGTALLAWVVAVAATGGWSEPVIMFWAAVITLGTAGAFLAADHVDVPA